jgi:hypothetical protein
MKSRIRFVRNPLAGAPQFCMFTPEMVLTRRQMGARIEYGI